MHYTLVLLHVHVLHNVRTVVNYRIPTVHNNKLAEVNRKGLCIHIHVLREFKDYLV